MRIGVAIPHGGLLATPAAVAATARASEELGYASLWSDSVERLVAAAAATTALPCVLLVGPRVERPAAVRLAGRAVAHLGDRLAYVAAEVATLTALGEVLPGRRLVDAGPTAPALSPAVGWSPQWPTEDSTGWIGRAGRGPLLPRLGRHPRRDELQAALIAGAEQFIVGLPMSGTLDEELAGFADVAELLAQSAQPAG